MPSAGQPGRNPLRFVAVGYGAIVLLATAWALIVDVRLRHSGYEHLLPDVLLTFITGPLSLSILPVYERWPTVFGNEFVQVTWMSACGLAQAALLLWIGHVLTSARRRPRRFFEEPSSDEKLEQRLGAVAWQDYDTAYGPAIDVPGQLRRLVGSNRQAALDAAHELWCGLCHQHVQLGSAALPALPFLLEALDHADRDIAVELLDILLGFALGVNADRFERFQRSMGRAVPPEEQWVTELRAALLAQVSRFQSLAALRDDDLSGFAAGILDELGTNHTAAGA